MGLFESFFNMKGSNWNYGLIAQNCTFIYLALKNGYPQKLNSQKKLLAVTGLIDLQAYWQPKQITIDEIIQMASQVVEKSPPDTEEIKILTQFICMVEYVIFGIDVPSMSRDTIGQCISSQVPTIIRTINGAYEKYLLGQIPGEFKEAAASFMNNPQWEDIRELLKI